MLGSTVSKSASRASESWNVKDRVLTRLKDEREHFVEARNSLVLIMASVLKLRCELESDGCACDRSDVNTDCCRLLTKIGYCSV